MKDVEYHAYQWIQSVGESSIFYEYNTLSAWLFNSGFASNDYKLPPYMFTSSYNEDSLNVLKTKFLTYRSKFGLFSSDLSMYEKKHGEINPSENEQYAIALNKTFTLYSNSFREEKPLDFYVINKFRLLKMFVVHSGTGQLPLKSFSEMKQNGDIIGISFKVIQSLLYWIILLTGLLGIVPILKHNRLIGLFFVFIIVYGLLVFPFFIKIPEIRFFCFVYPFLSISSGIFITHTGLLVYKRSITRQTSTT